SRGVLGCARHIGRPQHRLAGAGNLECSMRTIRKHSTFFFAGMLLGCSTTALAQLPPSITERNIPTASSGPSDITLGPDGALWFADLSTKNTARAPPAGGISEHPIPTANSEPEGITVGPDGALWFTEFLGNKIGRITTAGAISEYATGLTPNSFPRGITAGP